MVNQFKWYAAKLNRELSDNQGGIIGRGNNCSDSCRNKIQFMRRLLGSIFRAGEHHLEYTGWVQNLAS